MKKAEMRRLSGMLAAAVCIMAFIFFVWERPPAQSVTPEAAAAWLSGPILVQVGDQWHQTGGETVSLDFGDTTLECKKCEALADAFQTSAWQRIRRGDKVYAEVETCALMTLGFAQAYGLSIYPGDLAVFYDGYRLSCWTANRAYYQMPEGTFENIKTYVSC